MAHRFIGPNGQFQATTDEHYAGLLIRAGWHVAPENWPGLAPEPEPEPQPELDFHGTVPAQAVEGLPIWAIVILCFFGGVLIKALAAWLKGWRP